MKILFSLFRPAGVVLIAAAIAGLAQIAFAADKKEGRLTEVIRDVRLMASRAVSRPASVNDGVREGTAVRTGDNSRAEITFNDQSLARLGANTVFSFGRETRTYDLGSGAVLMYAPEKAGQVKIQTSVATAAVSGFTIMLESHAKTWSKLVVLHGHAKVFFKGFREPCQLDGGQMIVWPPHPRKCPPVLDIDLSKLLRGKLIKGFKGQLPELPIILSDSENQQASPPAGGLIDPTAIDTLDQRAAGEPPPPPPMRTPPGKDF